MFIRQPTGNEVRSNYLHHYWQKRWRCSWSLFSRWSMWHIHYKLSITVKWMNVCFDPMKMEPWKKTQQSGICPAQCGLWQYTSHLMWRLILRSSSFLKLYTFLRSSSFIRSSSFWGCLHFWICLDFWVCLYLLRSSSYLRLSSFLRSSSLWGCPHFWGHIHFLSRLHFWGRLHL